MTDEITCPVCASDCYRVLTGTNNEPEATIRCRDCGHEARVDYAIRQALRRKRAA